LEPGPFSPFDLDARDGLPPLPSEPGSEIAAEPPLEPPAPLTSATKEDLPADSPELAFGVGERPPAGQAPEGLADPKVTKEQILQGIRVEADQKQAEQKNLEREMAQSKIREYMEVFRKIQADRPLFHDDLRRLLRGSREGVGEGIEELCDRYGRNLLPEVKKAVVGVSKRSAARLNRGPRIEMLRLYGVPEPAILDSLTKEMELKINTRGGPRDRNDALILAAYLLIKYPPASATSSSPPNAKADRTPAAPRSVVGVAAPPVPRAVRSPQ